MTRFQSLYIKCYIACAEGKTNRHAKRKARKARRARARYAYKVEVCARLNHKYKWSSKKLYGFRHKVCKRCRLHCYGYNWETRYVVPGTTDRLNEDPTPKVN